MNKKSIPLSVRRHHLVATVRKALGDQDVIVGVSGGADSVALLLLCCAAASQDSANFNVVATHIHHGLRKSSDEEQVIVEQLCKQLEITCISKKVTVNPINGSIAAGARKIRYETLGNIATELNVNAVAVAHHAEDQLETMLMALCRGAGLRKLSGMATIRPLCGNVNLYRPLLHVEKQNLIKVCQLANFNWCDDPTNIDPTTPRGRLRNDVIPVLRELWPAADKHAANASTILHAAAESFDSIVPRGNEWDRSLLAELPSPVIDATLQQAIGEHATFETIQSITAAVIDESTEPRTFQFKHDCYATITAHKVSVFHS
ncbi:MAG: tRNA lysidine(34) synthetase TilS [Phycisphaerales bacterium]|jgi:tRNA(Ile)-lysidine synthetase-like protein|nr:tRNA lysidine(34) synthetase TilS [Phycisphaerales bacterium]